MLDGLPVVPHKVVAEVSKIGNCECNSCLPCAHIGAIIFTTFHQPIDLTGCFSGTRQLFDFQVEKVGTWHLQCCDFDIGRRSRHVPADFYGDLHIFLGYPTSSLTPWTCLTP